MPRPKKLQSAVPEDDYKSGILKELEKIALEAAPDAMKTLARAARGDEVTREEITAANSILDRVAGRPNQKDKADETNNAVADLLRDVLSARTTDDDEDSDEDETA